MSSDQWKGRGEQRNGAKRAKVEMLERMDAGWWRGLGDEPRNHAKRREPEAKPEMDRQDTSISSVKFGTAERHLGSPPFRFRAFSRSFAVEIRGFDVVELHTWGLHGVSSFGFTLL